MGKPLFVGRKPELALWEEVLAAPEGQAVLVVGQQGMGKTWLANKMAEVASMHPTLSCGTVRYEVTPTDGVEATMALMLDHAFEAAQVTEGSLDATGRRLEQWRALLNVVKIGDLIMSLLREAQRNTRDKFLEVLHKISERMPENARAIFIVDPEKKMAEDSDQAWAIVVRKLPAKIKFVFAQRQDDCLAAGSVFKSLANVTRIPREDLGVLDEQAVDELVNARAPEIGMPADVLRKALAQYEGHPFAMPAALDLIGQRLAIDELPADPTDGIAEAQWKMVCRQSPEAIRLLKAYAILEVAVPDAVVEAVSELDGNQRDHLLADRYSGGLIRREGDYRRIYHSLLSDHVQGRVPADEAKQYHGRAVTVYRQRLTADVKPDALAAARLPEHVLAVEGLDAFLSVFIDECIQPLVNLGLLDAATGLSHRALRMAPRGSPAEACVSGILGLIYQTRGDLDEAVAMHRKALKIHEMLGRLEGVATEYGNLGLICLNRGDLDEASAMLRKALKIDEKLGRLVGMANQYGNLGLVYQTRGDLNEAEAMLRKSLEIHEKIGQLQGVANTYGNLGLIQQMRGDLDGAEAGLRKSLDMKEKLGWLEGMASDSCNLGNVSEQRGDHAAAREHWGKAVELYDRIGMPHMVKRVRGLLDALEASEEGSGE